LAAWRKEWAAFISMRDAANAVIPGGGAAELQHDAQTLQLPLSAEA